MFGCLPFIDFLSRTIGGAIIGCWMMTDTIGHCFNNNRFIIFQCIFTCLFGGIVNGKYIGSIDTNCRYSIAGRAAASYPITFVLLCAWCWYRKSIVSTVENLNLNLIFKVEKIELAIATHQNSTIGHDNVAAKLNAAWASPSDAAPSPKYVITQRLLFGRRFNAYAAPTACGNCVAESDVWQRQKLKKKIG